MADTGTGDRAHTAEAGTQDAAAPQRVRSVLVLGANGPSGRRTVQQALERGLGVGALTRRRGSGAVTGQPAPQPLEIVAERREADAGRGPGTPGGQRCSPGLGDAVVVRGGSHDGRRGVLVAVASALQRHHLVRPDGASAAIRVGTAFVHRVGCDWPGRPRRA